MRQASVLPTTLVIAVFAWMPSASSAKRVALVIGIDAYDNLLTLRKAVNDQKADGTPYLGALLPAATAASFTMSRMPRMTDTIASG